VPEISCSDKVRLGERGALTTFEGIEGENTEQLDNQQKVSLCHQCFAVANWWPSGMFANSNSLVKSKRRFHRGHQLTILRLICYPIGSLYAPFSLVCRERGLAVVYLLRVEKSWLLGWVAVARILIALVLREAFSALRNVTFCHYFAVSFCHRALIFDNSTV
jgi:hypothetical protein